LLENGLVSPRIESAHVETNRKFRMALRSSPAYIRAVLALARRNNLPDCAFAYRNRFNADEAFRRFKTPLRRGFFLARQISSVFSRIYSPAWEPEAVGYSHQVGQRNGLARCKRHRPTTGTPRSLYGVRLPSRISEDRHRLRAAGLSEVGAAGSPRQSNSRISPACGCSTINLAPGSFGLQEAIQEAVSI
jgi:hypothetical protein